MRSLSRAFGVSACAVALALLGCDGLRQKGSTADSTGRKTRGVSFITRRAPIEFSFPAGWHVNRKENPFDLQCFSRFEDMNTGVFVFKKEDVALDSKPIDIFWTQVNDLKSKRRNFQEVEPLRTHEYDDKTVTSITYLGDKESTRNSYTFSLIEFRADPGTFAVVVQVSLPGDRETNKPIFESIVRSARQVP
jgi:hypothetical protein